MHSKLEQAYRLAILRGLYRVADRMLKVEIAPSPRGTAHTNGSEITIDPAFIDKLSYTDALFIVAHEYYHVIYDHCGRRNGRLPDVWNVACDVVINEHLVHKLGLKKPEGDIGGIYRDNPIFDGMPDTYQTSTMIYDWLIQNQVECSEGASMGDLVEDKADTKPDDAIRNKADREAEAKEHGNAEIKSVINVSDDKVQWIELLKAMRIESGRLVRREVIRNYSRPSRREEPTGVILPCFRHQVAMPKIDVYIDVSSSMDEHPRTIFKGLKSIFTQLSVYRPSFFAFNNNIQNIDMRSDRFDIGGGTDIRLVIDNCKQRKADLSIIITDCEDNVTKSDFADNMIIVSNNKTFADYITDDWHMVKFNN